MNIHYNKIIEIINKEIDFYINNGKILVAYNRKYIYEYTRGIIVYAYLQLYINLDEYIFLHSKLRDFLEYENFLNMADNKALNLTKAEGQVE